MKKLHQNLFYYYKGSSRPDKDVDSQIENNTTKAFINTLADDGSFYCHDKYLMEELYISDNTILVDNICVRGYSVSRLVKLLKS